MSDPRILPSLSYQDAITHRIHKSMSSGVDYTISELCPECGELFYVGEWPWCNGNPERHKR